MNGVYWAKTAGGAYNKERFCKFFLLATSSSTVAGWAAWQTFDLVWKGLSVISALLAIALPIIDWSKAIARRSSICGEWLQLAQELKGLWIQVEAGVRPEDELTAIYNALTSKEATVTAKEVKEGVNKKIQRAAYDEVLKTRGLVKS